MDNTSQKIPSFRFSEAEMDLLIKKAYKEGFNAGYEQGYKDSAEDGAPEEVDDDEEYQMEIDWDND